MWLSEHLGKEHTDYNEPIYISVCRHSHKLRLRQCLAYGPVILVSGEQSITFPFYDE